MHSQLDFIQTEKTSLKNPFSFFTSCLSQAFFGPCEKIRAETLNLQENNSKLQQKLTVAANFENRITKTLIYIEILQK